ncbi:MAG: ABC transporter permease [Candidatus Hodarchaeota archaeon]
MVLKANIKTARRALTRRKMKNISAILAITLGVSLLVGTQITTSTLRHFFKTNLLTSLGEVDLEVSNATIGGQLSSVDAAVIAELAPEAVGILPILSNTNPVSIGAQFEPYAPISGVPLNYNSIFGKFYDWLTEEEMDISTLLTSNDSVIMSSELADRLGLTKTTDLPVKMRTGFKVGTLVTDENNETTVVQTDTLVEFIITGLYDSYRPGMGAQHGNGLIMRLEDLQSYLGWGDPTTNNTDIINSYGIALKTDHFHSSIEKSKLEDYVETLEKRIEERELSYEVFSARLLIIEIIDLIFDFVNAFLTILSLLIVAVGILLIANIQMLSIEDKEFQTGVLRAVGAKRRDVGVIYLIETVFQGIIGGILGLGGGILFGWAIAFYIGNLWRTGAASITPIIDAFVVVLALLVGVTIAVITGLWPSIRASRVNVVDALRGIKSGEFSEGASRNYAFLGVILLICGTYLLLRNGLFDSDLQYFWQFTEGYDSIQEWENILLAIGFYAVGIGVVLSRYISNYKAWNIAGLLLWLSSISIYFVGFEWIEKMEGSVTNLMMYSMVELVAGSILLVGLNLTPLMNGLRVIFRRIPNFEGVSQIAPAMISAHKTRSTLTFAIFGVILTLNVMIATMVATNTNTMLSNAENDTREVDIVVNLAGPEVANYSYTNELYRLDSRIIDVIPFRSRDYINMFGQESLSLVFLENPLSPNFTITEDVFPLRMVEVKAEQIRGNATSAADPDWRYDFYMNSFPDGLREDISLSEDDPTLLRTSKQAWDLFFDPNFRMTAYNTTKYLEEKGQTFGGFGGDTSDITIDYALKENGTIIQNPIVFTDSFFLPIGKQIWLYMGLTPFNESYIPWYQQFTVAGQLDDSRGAGFPVGSFETGGISQSGSNVLGSILLPEHSAIQTSYFGPAAPTGRDQYNSFLLKTSLEIDDPELESIAQNIEEYTNIDGEGYRQLTGQNLTTAVAITLYSILEADLQASQQFTDMLQIYVSIGLVLGAVGMAVISIRNVSERKREIGMMRAVGFPRSQVILSVLMELFVLGIIGLGIGLINGLTVNVGFANMQDAQLAIPWDRIALYLGLITFIAFIAGAWPGWIASRIPPSEALRYVG